jgi:DNA-binding beta-propeller fold protein YncE
MTSPTTKGTARSYSSEFTNRLVRYDRRTHQFETAGADLLRPWYQPITLEPHTGSLMLHTTSIHPGLNRIYAADWMQGRYAYALDLTTLAVVARYDVGGGGALGVAVDPERDRLYVSSIWGVEVVDLATDTVGLSNRPVVVDAARNRVYLGSMVGGKFRILDRDTLAVVGEIPVGMGTRYPHLSRDGRYLFASSSTAHYYWEADALPDARR